MWSFSFLSVETCTKMMNKLNKVIDISSSLVAKLRENRKINIILNDCKVRVCTSLDNSNLLFLNSMNF